MLHPGPFFWFSTKNFSTALSRSTMSSSSSSSVRAAPRTPPSAPVEKGTLFAEVADGEKSPSRRRGWSRHCGCCGPRCPSGIDKSDGQCCPCQEAACTLKQGTKVPCKVGAAEAGYPAIRTGVEAAEEEVCRRVAASLLACPCPVRHCVAAFSLVSPCSARLCVATFLLVSPCSARLCVALCSCSFAPSPGGRWVRSGWFS